MKEQCIVNEYSINFNNILISTRYHSIMLKIMFSQITKWNLETATHYRLGDYLKTHKHTDKLEANNSCFHSPNRAVSTWVVGKEFFYIGPILAYKENIKVL